MRSSPVGWAVANVAINNGRSDPNGELAAQAPQVPSTTAATRCVRPSASAPADDGRRIERPSGGGPVVAMVHMKG